MNNLQENICRIHQMMGVLKEDRNGDLIKNAIDNYGIDFAFKIISNNDLVLSYLSDEDKLKYIKDKVIDNTGTFGSGIRFSSPHNDPIRIKNEDGIIHQIEFLGQSHARIELYEKGVYHNGYVISYENLSPQIRELIIKRLIEL